MTGFVATVPIPHGIPLPWLAVSGEMLQPVPFRSGERKGYSAHAGHTQP
jgi:hypothetical protein